MGLCVRVCVCVCVYVCVFMCVCARWYWPLGYPHEVCMCVCPHTSELQQICLFGIIMRLLEGRRYTRYY